MSRSLLENRCDTFKPSIFTSSFPRLLQTNFPNFILGFLRKISPPLGKLIQSKTEHLLNFMFNLKNETHVLQQKKNPVSLSSQLLRTVLLLQPEKVEFFPLFFRSVIFNQNLAFFLAQSQEGFQLFGVKRKPLSQIRHRGSMQNFSGNLNISFCTHDMQICHLWDTAHIWYQKWTTVFTFSPYSTRQLKAQKTSKMTLKVETVTLKQFATSSTQKY